MLQGPGVLHGALEERIGYLANNEKCIEVEKCL